MIISGIAILFHLVQVVYEMKKEGLGFCGYMKSLMTMGAGLPLKAITSDRIEKLDLSNQELLPAQVSLLAAAIGNNKSLREVGLRSCNIDDEGARHLASMLEKNTSLETLDLGCNKITDVSLKHLAIPLEKNTSLKELHLSSNNITGNGLKHLAIPLEKNTSLEELWLNGNKITDDGLKHLAIPLEKNTSLKWLSLSYNKITDDNLKRKLKDIWNKTKGRKGGLLF
jgi:Ran GTPase-activating protein (RanGAP) involved in mRNA processing and transport